MLFHLALWLREYVSGFNLFTYTTSRAVFATLTALSIGLILGPIFIRMASGRAGQQIREDGPSSHLTKQNTPTMGGAVILSALMITTLLWSDLTNPYIWALLATLVAFAAIGFADDWAKIRARNSRGLSARAKMLLQAVSAVVILTALAYITPVSGHLELFIPYWKNLALPLGVIGFVILGFFVVVGSSNAVNLTDGLDGLAIMPVVLIAGGLGLLAYVCGHANFASYLGFPFIMGAQELSIFCAAVAGAGLAFLWFNAYPAQVFMGDIGSLTLGAVLGMVAMIIRQEIVFFIMAGVFVVEALSVMVQVTSYKLTGKRIFRMAPLHHHFELRGWRENQVVVRFWIITVILVLLGLSALKIR